MFPNNHWPSFIMVVFFPIYISELINITTFSSTFGSPPWSRTQWLSESSRLLVADVSSLRRRLRALMAARGPFQGGDQRHQRHQCHRHCLCCHRRHHRRWCCHCHQQQSMSSWQALSFLLSSSLLSQKVLLIIHTLPLPHAYIFISIFCPMLNLGPTGDEDICS